MVSVKFTLKGKEFVVHVNPTVDPKEMISQVHKKILETVAKEKIELPEDSSKYLTAKIAKTLVLQYPTKGEEKPLELGELG